MAIRARINGPAILRKLKETLWTILNAAHDSIPLETNCHTEQDNIAKKDESPTMISFHIEWQEEKASQHIRNGNIDDSLSKIGRRAQKDEGHCRCCMAEPRPKEPLLVVFFSEVRNNLLELLFRDEACAFALLNFANPFRWLCSSSS